MVARSRMLFPPAPPTRSAETRQRQARPGPLRPGPARPATASARTGVGAGAGGVDGAAALVAWLHHCAERSVLRGTGRDGTALTAGPGRTERPLHHTRRTGQEAAAQALPA